MKKKIFMIFMVLVLVASAFLMCGPAPYKLNISTTGNGTVTTSPDPTDETYVDGTVVRLTATADTGWHFVEWQGDLTGSETQKEITIDGDKTVTAVFEKNQYTLTINIDGNGTVTTSPDPTDGTYTHGTVVSLTATADTSSYFNGWGGDLTGKDSPINITMDGNKSVTVNFEELELKDTMVDVPGGTYTQQGFSSSFTHTISSFSIGKYEVTYALWYTVRSWAEENGYKFDNQGMEGHDGSTGALPTSAHTEPVTTINWRDTIIWCNAYSEKSGFTPVYKYDGNVLKNSHYENTVNVGGEDKHKCDLATADPSANGYRLPTEGQWQYAASYKSDGSFTPYDWPSGASSDNDNDSKEVAWYSDEFGGDSNYTTHVVGGKKANDLGIYDMSGNVSEFCLDLYTEFPTEPQTDYANTTTGKYRILRGGSWYNNKMSIWVGINNYTDPDYETDTIGFRVARNQN